MTKLFILHFNNFDFGFIVEKVIYIFVLLGNLAKWFYESDFIVSLSSWELN
jgi:hypothetical protein